MLPPPPNCPSRRPLAGRPFTWRAQLRIQLSPRSACSVLVARQARHAACIPAPRTVLTGVGEAVVC